MLVMVALVLAQDPPQMSLVPDEGSVQQLAPASSNPAFGDRVGPRRRLRLMATIGAVVCG